LEKTKGLGLALVWISQVHSILWPGEASSSWLGVLVRSPG